LTRSAARSGEPCRATVSIAPTTRVGRVYPKRLVARTQHDRIDDPIERHEASRTASFPEQAAEEPPQPVILLAAALVQHDHPVLSAAMEEGLRACQQRGRE
jgi:hypothetical protein